MTIDIQTAQNRALTRITDLTEETQREVTKVKVEAERALANMANGFRASNYSHGFLGHQIPFDIAKLQTQLEEAVNTARILGCDSDSIAAAYQAGVK